MAESLKPVGFWSNTSSDDARTGGWLSRLRRLLADELQLRMGRRRQVQIFQDVAAIPTGADWLTQIYGALDDSSFLLPIVTPAFLESEMCCQEVMRFHQREKDLGRDNLIFSFHYIDVSHIGPDEVHDQAVLALSKSRQRFDFTEDARPRHLVVIARPFWLGRYPVTRDEYADFAAATRRAGDPWVSTEFPQDERHPVVNVSHTDAEAYVAWLSQQTGQTYRLPSDAEWEYAARAGTTTARYWGDEAGRPGEFAHFSANGTCPVGAFPPNAFGLFDMLGNVWEWTRDLGQMDYRGAPSDGSAWTGGAGCRIVRGGSWSYHASYVRAAYRNGFDETGGDDGVGIRCARGQV